MSMLPVVIPPGVVRGASPNDARGRWYDTNLIRWQNGVLKPVGGWERLTTTAFTSRINRMINWRDNNLTPYLLIASLSSVQVDYGSGWVDITPTGLGTSGSGTAAYGYGVGAYGAEDYGDARTVAATNFELLPRFWSLANWGEQVLAVSSIDGRLWKYDPATPSTDLAELAVSGIPTNNTSVLVTPERYAMLLGAGGEARRIGWCSREDYTDWDFASTTNTAGYLDLETTTPLLVGVNSRMGPVIFSQSMLFQMAYVGLPFIYGSRPVGITHIIAPHTVVSAEVGVLWWDAGGFKLYNGGTIQPVPCPVWDYIQSDINTTNAKLYAHASVNGVFPEVWWFYPSAASETCDRYVVFNYAENWWAIGAMARSAMIGAETSLYPYAAGEDGHIYKHESGWAGDSGAIREVWAETSPMQLGAGDRGMEILQGLPGNGRGYASMQFRFYSNRTPEGAEREFGPYVVRSDGYLDMRVNGRDIRMRVENTADANWSFGEMRLDVVPGAGR